MFYTFLIYKDDTSGLKLREKISENQPHFSRINFTMVYLKEFIVPLSSHILETSP